MDGVVEVQGGRIRGTRRNGVWAFSGVPYAGSPSGHGRWRPPGPAAQWTGTRECDGFGPIAPQAPGILELSLGGEPDEHAEDCLSLNIWTPELDGGRRPVMVWIHGGSFVSGSGAGSLYRGGMLAREQDLVVVTINYRLGVLGFMAHPVLSDPDQSWLDGRPWSGFGNWGLADQMAALSWVRDHAADFGGDPANVTVFGESAGGMSVSALMGAAGSGGLFHRAIVESGPPYSCTADQASARAERMAAFLDIPMSRRAWESVPVGELVRAAAEVGRADAHPAESGLLFMPVVDDGLLSSTPEDQVASGSASDIPLLIGTTRDESSFFTVGDTVLSSLDEAGLQRWAERVTSTPDLAEDLIAQFRSVRASRGDAVTPRDLWVALATEFVFRLPTLRFADAHARAADPNTGTFCYLFTWESPAFGGILGSCHALDIPFVFGTVHNPAVQVFAGSGDDAFALSQIMREDWAGFARSGVPGRSGPPRRSEQSDSSSRSPSGGSSLGWAKWDVDRRPTTVLGPWPQSEGLRHRVDRPRDEELEALGHVVPDRSAGPVAP